MRAACSTLTGPASRWATKPSASSPWPSADARHAYWTSRRRNRAVFRRHDLPRANRGSKRIGSAPPSSTVDVPRAESSRRTVRRVRPSATRTASWRCCSANWPRPHLRRWTSIAQFTTARYACEYWWTPPRWASWSPTVMAKFAGGTNRRVDSFDGPPSRPKRCPTPPGPRPSGPN